MATKNYQAYNETLGINASDDKSAVRVINFSSPGDIPKSDSKKSPAYAYDTEGKTCANSSKIPRPPLATSNSFNETLRSDIKSKKPSMIPRSRSRRRKENEKVKFDIPSKTETVKSQADDNSKKQNGDLAVKQRSGAPLGTCETPVVLPKEINSGERLIRVSSLNLKSCQDLVEITKEGSDTSYKDAQEEISSLGSNVISPNEREQDRTVENAEDKETDQVEAVRQDRTIRYLYETLKCTVGPVFDKWIGGENTTSGEPERLYSDLAVDNFESVPDFSSIQGHYEFTLKEISNIWRNTISLMGSVRDHAVKFVEGGNRSIDKEQLTLEAEMLQLALDFAISYSKLKTDFLINLARKRLNVKSLQKTELENFMDSKTFAALYSNEDLAAMARTVQDLNASLLKGEDPLE